MQFPLSMCDYQLLGDGYGYHPNYPPNSNPGGPNIESQPPGSSNAVMASMMSSSAIGGNPAYGMIPPHGSRTHGLPQRSLSSFGAPLPMPPGSSGPGLIPGLGGPGGLGDASKMHDPYASGSFTGGSSQSAMRGGHYPSHGCRYGHSNSGYPVPMGSGPGGSSSLSGMSQHNGGIVPQSSLASLPSSNSYQARGLMSGYNDQRMLSPILGPGPGGGYPGSYASSYGSGHSGGTSARIWHSHGMNHVQQRPPYGYNTGNPAPSPLPPHSSHHNNSRSGQAGQQAQQQLQQSQSQVQSTRSSYYNSSSGRVGASSSLSSFIPSEASSMSPYLPSSYNSQNGSVSQGNSGSSRLPDTISSSSGANSGSRQSHYTGYSTNGHGSSVASGTLGMLPNTSGSMNYPGQQYQAYNVSQGYSDNSSRLSPYTMNSASSTPGSVSTAGQNTVPNSPGYRSPFNTSPYPPSKVSSGNISSSGSMNSNSSCMVAAAAAAANSNSSNVPVNYLQHNLTPSGSADSEACLSNISNLPLTISDTIFNGSKMNESQMNNNADPVITSEPTLNSVFNGSDIEFSSLNFPTVEASAAANYAQQMRIDGTGPKKKKERSKKHKKKDKNKSIDRISMHPNSNANLNNNLSLFPYHQANSHYHDNFSNPMNQSCNNFEQSHHQNPAHPSMFLLSLFLPQSKSSSTLYSEPNSTSNQQLQVPQTQASSISQSLQSTGPPPSISETQSSHLQSKPNIMPQSEMVPRASPACFDTTALNNLQSDLLNGALGDQLSNTGSRHSSHSNHSNHTNSSLDYPKSHADDASQSIIAHHNSENNNCAASSNLGTTDNDNHNNHINSQIPEKFSSLEDELSFLAAAEECESSSQNEINPQVGPQIISNSESHGISMDRHQQPQQTPQSSAAPVEAQPTLTNTPVSSTSSCMVQSASVSTISVPCVVDSILSNSCAISDDQLTIKSTTTTNSKGYQTDFIPNQQQRISPIASEIGIDVNNVENKINNESGLVKKKKKSKESKAKIFCPQKIIQGQSSTCNNKKANSVINIVPVHNDSFNKMTNHLKNKSLLSHVTTCKPVEVTNIKKSIDMKDHEGKFFKIRPASNTTTIMTLNTVPEPGIKTNCKVIKKRKLEDAKEQKSAVDEYEFPDSPTHSSSAKKVKKINLENSKKKVTEKLLSNNNCSITINKKVSIKPKLKVNQSFTGNTASTRLNISEKTEIINIDGPRPKNMNEKSQFNKIQIEEKVLKIQEKKQHVNNFNNDNHNQHANTLHHQSPRLHKDSSKVTSITVQEILPSSIPALSLASSQSSNKNITSTINIVSLGKKSTTNGSNQSKKESISRSNVINHHPSPTNTLTTIVPITSNTLNTSIIIANPPTSSNPTTAITQQPQIHLPQPVTAQPQQSHHISPIKNFPNQNILMQSTATNTPRRRSQDKKALTIREGLMRTGDFVVSFDESESELPMIWRIEGKSLLQRFEPSEQEGQIVYTNTSSYSAWNPTVKQRYTGVDVRIVGCNRTKIVVEKLGLTRTNTNYDRLDSDKGSNGPNIISNGEITVEKCKTPEEKEPNNFQHQADFEVFIQTLISQALDANFISEIIKENDEYFLSHIQAIDDFCNKKKSRFFTKVKWDAHIVKCVETFSKFNIIPQSQVGDLRCRLCHDNWSTQILHFTGKTYDQVTLETKEPIDIKQTKYAACDECKEKVALFSDLHHQKFNFFTKCRDKVEEMRGGVEDKDSPMILEECLKDTEWMQSLFKQFEEIWQSCDRIR